MASLPRYFVPANGRPHPHMKGARVYEVIDRQTDKCVFDGVTEFEAHRRCKKYNIQTLANPGGGSNRKR